MYYDRAKLNKRKMNLTWNLTQESPATNSKIFAARMAYMKGSRTTEISRDNCSYLPTSDNTYHAIIHAPSTTRETADGALYTPTPSSTTAQVLLIFDGAA